MGEYARVRLTVTGTVQGVGYRYFAIRAARRLGVHGWVRNHPGGSVEVLAEGPAGMIKEFVTELRRGPVSADVTDVIVQPEPYHAEFKEFELKY